MQSTPAASGEATSTTSSPYAEPQRVASLDDCTFYHTMELPGHGLVRGAWDLRPNVGRYLGDVDVKGKRVLEVGTASGYLCMHMERQGADVVAFDLAPDEDADIVPFARQDALRRRAEHREFMRRIRNGFWLNHAAHRSNAKVVHGTVYRIPRAIGAVDVATFGAILLHLRDPFLALESALHLTRETVIVTEPMARGLGIVKELLRRGPRRSTMGFQPRAELADHPTAWWQLRPGLIRRFVAVLGFEDTRVRYHFQHQESAGRVLFYTVVGRRTVPIA